MEKKDYSIILHIGIQRTGSTFLQQEIFPKIKEVNFVNFRRHKGIKFEVLGDKEVQNIVINFENCEYKDVYEKIYSRFKEDKVNLISNENIWWHQRKKEEAKLVILQKIQHFFPDVKIIFGIRDKTGLLLSWYKKYVMDGGVLSFTKFQEEVVTKENLDYDSYINNLIKMFGKNNVYVYQFGDMKKDINKHVKDICDFMGVETPEFENKKRNIGYSLWQLKVSLLLNNLFRTKANSKGIIPLHRKWHPHRILFQSPLFPEILRGKKITRENLER